MVVHPGKLIAPLVLEPSGISQSELARRLGFNQPQPVNELVNGKRGFTPRGCCSSRSLAVVPRYSGHRAALHDCEAVRRRLAPGSVHR